MPVPGRPLKKSGSKMSSSDSSDTDQATGTANGNALPPTSASPETEVEVHKEPDATAMTTEVPPTQIQDPDPTRYMTLFKEYQDQVMKSMHKILHSLQGLTSKVNKVESENETIRESLLMIQSTQEPKEPTTSSLGTRSDRDSNINPQSSTITKSTDRSESPKLGLTPQGPNLTKIYHQGGQQGQGKIANRPPEVQSSAGPSLTDVNEHKEGTNNNPNQQFDQFEQGDQFDTPDLTSQTAFTGTLSQIARQVMSTRNEFRQLSPIPSRGVESSDDFLDDSIQTTSPGAGSKRDNSSRHPTGSSQHTNERPREGSTGSKPGGPANHPIPPLRQQSGQYQTNGPNQKPQQAHNGPQLSQWQRVENDRIAKLQAEQAQVPKDNHATRRARDWKNRFNAPAPTDVNDDEKQRNEYNTQATGSYSTSNNYGRVQGTVNNTNNFDQRSPAQPNQHSSGSTLPNRHDDRGTSQDQLNDQYEDDGDDDRRPNNNSGRLSPINRSYQSNRSYQNNISTVSSNRDMHNPLKTKNVKEFPTLNSLEFNTIRTFLQMFAYHLREFNIDVVYYIETGMQDYLDDTCEVVYEPSGFSGLQLNFVFKCFRHGCEKQPQWLSTIDIYGYSKVLESIRTLSYEFARITPIVKMRISQTFSEMGQRPNEALRDYYIRFLIMRKNSEICNIPHSEDEYCQKYLSGLNVDDTLKMYVINEYIRNKGTLESVHTYTADTQEVKRIHLALNRHAGTSNAKAATSTADGMDHDESAAVPNAQANYLTAKDKSNRSDRRSPSYKAQHDTSQPKPGVRFAKDIQSVTCYNCQDKGHYSNDCPKPKIVQPPGASRTGASAKVSQSSSAPNPTHMFDTEDEDSEYDESNPEEVDDEEPSGGSAAPDPNFYATAKISQAEIRLSSNGFTRPQALAALASPSTMALIAKIIKMLSDSGAYPHQVTWDVQLINERVAHEIILTLADGTELRDPIIGSLLIRIPCGIVILLKRVLKHRQLEQCLFSPNAFAEDIADQFDTLMYSLTNGVLEYSMMKTGQPAVKICTVPAIKQAGKAPLHELTFEIVPEEEAKAFMSKATIDMDEFMKRTHRALNHPGKTGIHRLYHSNAILDTRPIEIPAILKHQMSCESCDMDANHKGHAKVIPDKYKLDHRMNANWGADLAILNKEGRGGVKVHLVMVEYYSNLWYGVALSDKSSTTIAKSIKFILTHFNNKFGNKPGSGNVVRLYTDNGGEFTGEPVQKVLRDIGAINPRITTYEHPELGKVENIHGKILRSAVKVLTEAKAPWLLWSDLYPSIIYVHNHASVAVGQTMTPHQIANGSECIMKANHFHPWGCTGYVTLPEEQRTAQGKHLLDARGLKMIFVGYDDESGKHLMMNPKTTVVTKCHSVNFKDDDYSAMKELKDSQMNTDDDDSPLDVDDFADRCLAGEIKLTKMISLVDDIRDNAFEEVGNMASALDRHDSERSLRSGGARSRAESNPPPVEQIPKKPTPKAVVSDDNILPEGSKRRSIYAGKINLGDIGNSIGAGPRRQARKQKLAAKAMASHMAEPTRDWIAEVEMKATSTLREAYSKASASIKRHITPIHVPDEPETDPPLDTKWSTVFKDHLDTLEDVEAAAKRYELAAQQMGYEDLIMDGNSSSKKKNRIPKMYIKELFESPKKARKAPPEPHWLEEKEAEYDKMVYKYEKALDMNRMGEAEKLGLVLAKVIDQTPLKAIVKKSMRKRIQKMTPKAIETNLEKIQRFKEKLKAQHKMYNNVPFDPSRKKCNKNGELVEPSQRCIADNKKGEQCGRRTKNGAYCRQHLEKILYLAIRKSKIANAGRGLFTTKAWKRGDYVADYTGQISNDPNVDHKGSNYVFDINSKGTTIDAAPTSSAPGRFVNAPTSSGLKSNLTWSINHEDQTVRLKAIRDIEPGEELLIPYGSSYWARHRKIAKELNKRDGQIDMRTAQALYSTMNHTEEMLVISDRDPKTMAEAMRNPATRKQWYEGIEAENKKMIENKVFGPVLDELPPGKRAVSAKYVYKIKRDPEGNPIKYKVRFVARGFTQREGIDYDEHEVATSTLAIQSLRTLIAFVTANDYICRQLDVTTAYLHAELKEDIYIQVPPEMAHELKGKYVKLHKSLYGLHQSGWNFNELLIGILKDLGYNSDSMTDKCIMTKLSNTGRNLILAIYVDDVTYACHPDDEVEMERDITILGTKLSIQKIGDLQHLLGIKVTRDSKAGTTTISQRQYVIDLANEYGLDVTTTKAAATPAVVGSSRVDLQACKLEYSIVSPK